MQFENRRDLFISFDELFDAVAHAGNNEITPGDANQYSRQSIQIAE